MLLTGVLCNIYKVRKFCAIANTFRTEQANVCEQEFSSVAKKDQDWLLSAEESPWNTDPLIEIAA